MKKIFIFFLLMFSSLLPAETFTPEEIAYMRKAVNFYRDFHNGNYRLVVTKTTLSNKMVVADVAIICAGEIHKGRMQYPAVYEKYITYNNFFRVGGGSIFKAGYSRRIISRFFIGAEALYAYDGKGYFAGTLEIGF